MADEGPQKEGTGGEEKKAGVGRRGGTGQGRAQSHPGIMWVTTLLTTLLTVLGTVKCIEVIYSRG